MRRLRTKDIARDVGIGSAAVRVRLAKAGIEPCGKDGHDHLYYPADVWRAFPVLMPVDLDDRAEHTAVLQ